MSEEINLAAVDSTFEDKVYILADEILIILKELHRDNKRQINSQLIADKMVCKYSVKNILSDPGTKSGGDKNDIDLLKGIANEVLDRFGELIPSDMLDQLGDVKDQLHCRAILQGSTQWLDSPFAVIKQYMDTITTRNDELEDFIKQTMQYLADTEVQLASELYSQKEKFTDDETFTNNMTRNMNMIKQDISRSSSVGEIKNAVMSKIENINRGLEKKRKKDMEKLKKTESTLQEMSRRMNEMKAEAEEIRRKAQKIEDEAVHDGLTGIYNRKAYDKRIAETLANVKRYDEPVSLMICDIDYFKKINDEFGHKVGDLALKKLAALLQERLRVNDFIARYGGEEFTIILPHTDLEGALKAGEGIRSYIDEAVFSYKEHSIPLTVSIGVSRFRKDDDTHSAFERADQGLYLAKRSGRNMVKTEADVENEGTVLNQSAL